jgi:ABC-type antimicrobial peptide transport system permease subunit
VLKLILKSGMTLVTVGLTIGLAGAFVLTRLMATLLFEVSPTDPITFGVVALCVILATLLACYIPARRATKVDPLVALRSTVLYSAHANKETKNSHLITQEGSNFSA